MGNIYLAKDIEWLRAKRDELFELLDKGHITRVVEGGGTVTEFPEKSPDLKDLLQQVIAAIATMEGATAAEIAAAAATKKNMKICTRYR